MSLTKEIKELEEMIKLLNDYNEKLDIIIQLYKNKYTSAIEFITPNHIVKINPITVIEKNMEKFISFKKLPEENATEIWQNNKTKKPFIELYNSVVM